MKTFFVNGTILTPDQRLDGYCVIVEDLGIVDIVQGTPEASDAITIDAHGHYIIPGMIDIHIHGSNGLDTMDATPDAIHVMSRFLARHGVTSFLPTTVTDSVAGTFAAIDNVVNTPQATDGAHHLGIHLEGPYLAQEYRGAQPLQHLRVAAPDEYSRWFTKQIVRLITVAPEVPGVPELVRAGRRAGVEFAVGHSQASYESVIELVELGVHQATHTFNGMPPLHHRTPGVVGAVLSDDRIYAQIIVDGNHLHPAVVKLIINAKGIDRTILISDAIRATGMPDGSYALGDQQVQVTDGVARTQAGGLAGSTLTMDNALRNTMQYTGLNIWQVLPMATRVPAESIELARSKGQIARGFDADLVILDNACRVHLTMAGGRIVFNEL